ncbi:hypothetical protein ACFQJ7_16825 [Halovenus rubra]|uniref:Uncharacterized protein n=2 Tax=Halovenus rubra TaxID=869890 RepID=A0ACC7DW67_9EURY|nr:hypothetical protein [Halovenus rubra]
MTLRSHSVTQNSTVVTGLVSLRNRVISACKQSRLIGPLVTTVGQRWESRTSADRTTMDRQQSAIKRSWLRTVAQRVVTGSVEATRASQVAGVATNAQHVVTSSWSYRWLVTDPDPDLVVIDLRQTLTVGPWLRVIARTLNWVLPAAVSSTLVRTSQRLYRQLVVRPVQIVSLFFAFGAIGLLATATTGTSLSVALVFSALGFAFLAAIGSRITMSWHEVQETRGYRRLAKIFDPPEPSESQESDTQATQQNETDSPPLQATDRLSETETGSDADHQ